VSEIEALQAEVANLTKVVGNLANPIPFERQLWNKAKLAEFFNCSIDSVDRIRVQKGFPKGRRRNVDSDRGGLIWRACEVVDWTDTHVFEEVG